MAQDDCGDVCWICLEAETEGNPLKQVCGCPRRVHHPCMARWQLHSAGKKEEQKCRFCEQQLPDWRPAMTPQACKPVTPYMRVSFGGKTYKVAVAPGAEGAKQFEVEIRKLLKLPESQEFDVIFHCKAPGSGDKLQLQGLGAFDAAVHCASVSSGQKAAAKQQSGEAAATNAPAAQQQPQQPQQAEPQQQSSSSASSSGSGSSSSSPTAVSAPHGNFANKVAGLLNRLKSSKNLAVA